MEPFLIDVHPGGERTLSTHEGEEFIYVLERRDRGRVRQGPPHPRRRRQHLLRLDRAAPGARGRRRRRAHPGRRLRPGLAGSRRWSCTPTSPSAQYFERQVAAEPGPRLHRLPGPRPALELRASSTSAWTSSPRACWPSASARATTSASGRATCPTGSRFMFATAKIGAVLVTVNPVYKSHELAYVIKQSDMKALVHHRRVPRRRLREIVRELVPEAAPQERGHLPAADASRASKSLIYMGPEKHRGFYNVPELLLLGEHTSDERAARPRAPPPPATTSSTCSTPRAPPASPRASCSRTATSSTTASTSASGRSSRRAGPRVPAGAALPLLRHACWACWRSLTHGATMVMRRAVRPAAGAGGRAEGAGDRALRRAHDVHRRAGPPDVRHVRPDARCAPASWPGRPCPIETMRQVIDRMHCGEMTICYGLTEASPVFTQTTHRRHARAQVRDRRRKHDRGRGARRRPGDRRGLPARRAGRARAAAATTS